MLQFRDLSFRRGPALLLEGASLTIYPGQKVGLVGANGCGKSTQLQIVAGDLPLCYVNDLTVYGRRGGRGESICERKRRMA